MNLKDFEHLAAQARQQPAPRVDVEQAVLARLAGLPARELCTAEASRLWASTFACLAGVGAIAASLAVVVGAQAWSSLTDPLAGLMNSMVVMIP